MQSPQMNYLVCLWVWVYIKHINESTQGKNNEGPSMRVAAHSVNTGSYAGRRWEWGGCMENV